VDWGVYALFLKPLVLVPMLHWSFLDSWVITIGSGFSLDMWQTVFIAGILISQALFNHYGIKLTTMLTDFSGYLIFVFAVLLTGALLIWTPVKLDFARLFTFTNFTGPAGGSYFPNPEPAFLAFLLGLLFVLYTITGFDASAHTSEETHDAQVNVPKGMWTAVFWSWVSGFIMVATFVLVLPSVTEGAAAGGNSWFYMYDASHMPLWLKGIISIGLTVSNYLCALAGLTSCSRMMFAFARDGGLPFSSALSRVSTQYRTPTYAIWTSIALAWISTLYGAAFLVLATGCAVFLYLSYAMPIAAGLLAEGKTWKEKGPFNLGAWSKPNAVLAVIGAIVLLITGFFPPNEKVFYLTIGMVVVMVILWYALERNRFEGVPEGDKITERQKMIADIESKYKD